MTSKKAIAWKIPSEEQSEQRIGDITDYDRQFSFYRQGQTQSSSSNISRE